MLERFARSLGSAVAVATAGELQKGDVDRVVIRLLVVTLRDCGRPTRSI